MNLLSAGLPIGQWWGITVRIHFTLLLFGFVLATSYGNFLLGLAIVIGLWGSILLHEFGHALAARWCDGECAEILLWPLGGLAFARPAWHPTAHLITSAAGPFVSLVLWVFFWALSVVLDAASAAMPVPVAFYVFVRMMARLNLWLLIFNVCVPAFPMDGGRILRDTLWHFTRAETATRIAMGISQLIALVAAAWAVGLWVAPQAVPDPPFLGPIGMLILAVFIFSQSAHERHIVAAEAAGAYGFSLRERIQRSRRRRAFHQAVTERQQTRESGAFHRCAKCGVTDRDSPSLEFRVCTDCANGEEYCPEHLDRHTHTGPLASRDRSG
jgi:Zn-dependent protease